MIQGCRLPVFEEAEEGLDRRQPDIARHRRVFALVLEILQEGADEVGVESAPASAPMARPSASLRRT